MDPKNVVFDAKRLIGRRFGDPVLNDFMKFWWVASFSLVTYSRPFTVLNNGDKPQLQVSYKGETRTFCPEEIYAMLLTKMRYTVESYVGKPVRQAVISVPVCWLANATTYEIQANFNDSQRQAIKDAGSIAGWNVLRLIVEPTAAAFAFTLDKLEFKGERNILVFDLGGGKLDISLLTIENGILEVKAVSGNSRLGGINFDARLATHFAGVFKNERGKDISNDPVALHRLRIACEKAKRTLSYSDSALIKIDSLHGEADFRATVTRKLFEDLNEDLFAPCISYIEDVLAEGKVHKSNVKEIVLVGGSTRIPKVKQLIQDFFNGKYLNASIDPEEAVAYGATLLSAMLRGVKDQILEEFLVLEVNPLELYYEASGGVMTLFIPRNNTTPNRKTQEYRTYKDNQSDALIKIYETERPGAPLNLLGEFTLSGISPAPKGCCPIEISLYVDANNIAYLEARDRANPWCRVTVQKKAGRLSREEIEQLVEVASLLAMEDKK